MPTYANDPCDRPLTEADFDEVISFWEDTMAECEDEEDAIGCCRLEFELERTSGPGGGPGPAAVSAILPGAGYSAYPRAEAQHVQGAGRDRHRVGRGVVIAGRGARR